MTAFPSSSFSAEFPRELEFTFLEHSGGLFRSGRLEAAAEVARVAAVPVGPVIALGVAAVVVLEEVVKAGALHELNKDVKIVEKEEGGKERLAEVDSCARGFCFFYNAAAVMEMAVLLNRCISSVQKKPNGEYV